MEGGFFGEGSAQVVLRLEWFFLLGGLAGWSEKAGERGYRYLPLVYILRVPWLISIMIGRHLDRAWRMGTETSMKCDGFPMYFFFYGWGGSAVDGGMDGGL